MNNEENLFQVINYLDIIYQEYTSLHLNECSKYFTLFYTKSLIGLVGPHLRLFLILNRLPLVKSVLEEIVLIALLQNES